MSEMVRAFLQLGEMMSMVLIIIILFTISLYLNVNI